jgi:tetratricopeptide (TPR) repeat protein
MLPNPIPKRQSELVLPVQPLRSVLADDETNPLALILRPEGELSEIALLKGTHVSAQEHADARSAGRAQWFQQELEHVARKAPRFSNSPTFLNRLANLARAAGDLEKERELLAEARALTEDAFFTHRYANNLLSRGEEAEAEGMFATLGSIKGVQALLKLAALHVRRWEIAKAREIVDRAVAVDPLDFGVRLFEGGLCLVAREYDRAIHSFRVAAEDRPTSSVLFENLASAYLKLGQHEKGYAALKRAVVLDPLNAAALFVFADEAFRLKRDDDVIAPLRLYLESEQTNSAAFARLARAYMQIGDRDSALKTLRMQASIDDSSAVWNNIGVVRALQNDTVTALQCFNHAVQKANSTRDPDALLATRNIAQAFAARSMITKLVQFTSHIVEGDVDGRIRQHAPVADIYAFHLNGLRIQKRREPYLRLAEAILDKPDTAPSLAAWTLSSIVAHYALNESSPEKAEAAIERWLPGIVKKLGADIARHFMLINNVAFAYAEAGHLEEAERFIAKIGQYAHKEPYSTATLGLIDIRKGNISRGVDRYREAIALAQISSEKARLRQKLALELGRYWISRSPAKARRYLERVVSIPHGESSLIAQAKQALDALS